jgi:hypothetical protein
VNDHATPPTPPANPWRAQAVQYATMTDELFDMLEGRISALEQVAATRWPARVIVRARLGRTLRASIAPFPGVPFRARRVDAISNEWLSQ